MLYVFFFNETAPTEIYTLSLHDALPISSGEDCARRPRPGRSADAPAVGGPAHPPARRGRAVDGLGRRPRYPTPVGVRDRKSTRLNSSHANISYAVFCLKKKKQNNT